MGISLLLAQRAKGSLGFGATNKAFSDAGVTATLRLAADRHRCASQRDRAAARNLS
jgi:hypothetical protein